MNIVFDMDKKEQTSQKKELDRKNMLVVIILGLLLFNPINDDNLYSLYKIVGLLFLFAAFLFVISKKLPNKKQKGNFRTAPKATKFLITITILLTTCFYLIFNQYKGLNPDENLSLKSEKIILYLTILSFLIISIGLFIVNKLSIENRNI